MAIEIELKVHLGDIAPIKEQLSVLGEYCSSFKKSDSYWIPVQSNAGGMSIPSTGVRIRYESGVSANGVHHQSVLVTYKSKEISGGIEVNKECEFSVSDAAHFEELLGHLGLYNDICKEKEGWAWTIHPAKSNQAPILAEISMVSGLGWFLELEILIADTSEQTIEESRGRLLALLEKLKISPEQIEARPYTVMLKEAQGVNGNL